jgi:hypothetical protein
MDNIDYECKNGAYHEYFCCDTCWNSHPSNKKGEMLLYSAKYFEIVKQNFIQKAIENGFTQHQTIFLHDMIAFIYGTRKR